MCFSYSHFTGSPSCNWSWIVYNSVCVCVCVCVCIHTLISYQFVSLHPTCQTTCSFGNTTRFLKPLSVTTWHFLFILEIQHMNLGEPISVHNTLVKQISAQRKNKHFNAFLNFANFHSTLPWQISLRVFDFNFNSLWISTCFQSPSKWFKECGICTFPSVGR